MEKRSCSKVRAPACPRADVLTLLLASTFTDSLARLTGDEQKAVKLTAMDLQLNPSSPGHSFHKLDKARDRNFWSVRVNADIRVIVHKTADSLLLCYVDHHDKAYAWAERRKLEVHPTTGAAQLVEVRESVVEIPVPRYVETAAPVTAKTPPVPRTAKRCFPGATLEQMLALGVPEEWVGDALAATEDSIFDLTDHLPAEAAERLIEWATGVEPMVEIIAAPTIDPFEHPDAKRRFRIMQNAEELERALDYPWEKWSVFLHPAQRDIVERRYSGPARVAGSAGTGKTVVAIHRAVHLARSNPDARILLTTFSITLARMLQQRLRALIGSDAALGRRITVDALDEVAIAIYQREFGKPTIATSGMIASLLHEIAARVPDHRFTDPFLRSEWHDVVDAWQLRTWDEYRDVARLGRRTRLGEKQRKMLWDIFAEAIARLDRGALLTQAMVYGAITKVLVDGAKLVFDYVVFDEAQDASVPQLRFLAALAGRRADGLFLAGDLGQRIFQAPFSWKSLGVDVRGRSNTLRINYRTSHQIRTQADRLLEPEIADVDGNVESRRNTVSAFNGPAPEVRISDDEVGERGGIADWIKARIGEGIQPHEVGVFVRSAEQVPRARAAINAVGYEPTVPQPGVDPEPGKIVLMPMHLAKGLEFRAVVVAACDDDVVPLQSRIESSADDSELEEVYNTERHLLYVACTRARDALLVTAVKPGSEFLADLAALSGSKAGNEDQR